MRHYAIIHHKDGRIERRDVTDHIAVILRAGTTMDEATAMVIRLLGYIIPMSVITMESIPP